MILSIGMIVKNEEKYLDQCLKALKPILDNVDSELIIADTGSTDGTVDIAKKYTDNVYYFEWVNDFSAARNSTLERARGEWYMFIDADEVFQNCDDIIRFFNSGEYKKYSTASFVVRSYTVAVNGKVERSVYKDFSAVRLTKKSDNICFEGSVHEQFSIYRSPLKNLSSIADHYGYLFYNEEDAKKKSERNLKLLLEKLDALNRGEPVNDSLLYKEIADAYSLVNNKEKEKEYIDLGLKNISHSNLRIVAYYTKKAILLYFDDKNYDELLELCKDYFNKDTNPSRKSRLISDITMYAYKGKAEYQLERYQEAIDDFCDFFDIYRDYINNKFIAEDALFDTFGVMESDVFDIYLIFLESCIKERKYSIANRYLKSFNISGAVSNLKYNGYTEQYIKLTVSVMNNSSFNNLSYIFDQLDENNRNLLTAEVRRSIFGADKEKKENILKNLESVSKSDPRTENSAQICCNYVKGNPIEPSLINDYIKKYGAELNEDILCVMMEKDMDITAFVTSPDYDPKNYVYSIFKISDKPLELFEKYNTGSISKEGFEKAAETYKYAMIKATDYSSPISQMLIRQGILKKTDISKLLEKYASIGNRYLSEYGTKNIPPEIKTANIVDNIVKAREEKDYDTCLNELQRLVILYPEFNSVIKDYKEAVENEKPAPLSEFEQMALQVKQNIRGMIKAGNFADALEVLKEYQTLCPNDGEAEILRSEINSLLS